MSSNTAIVNVSFGAWYPAGQVRLKQSLDAIGYKGDTLFYGGENELAGCPLHKEHPYVFKGKALMEALRRGYQYIFWLDSSIKVVKPLDEVFRLLDTDGYYFVSSGQRSLGEWASDKALEYFDINREQSFTLPELASSVMGFNVQFSKAREFLLMFHLAAMAGVFDGSKTNEHNQVSVDSRVKGHRQDQTAASLIAHLLRMGTFHCTLHYRQFLKELLPETMFLNDGGY